MIREAVGLVPAISLQKKNPVRNPRSILATYTGLYDLYRLMFSRLAQSDPDVPRPLSTAFSFNSEEGACPVCRGLGSLTVCDPELLVTHPNRSLTGGALDGTKTGRFYGDPDGQYVAALQAVGQKLGIDFSIPWNTLDPRARTIAMEGCGEEIFQVSWRYRRGNHTGMHLLETPWRGFMGLVGDEYSRKHADERGDQMMSLMKQVECSHCGGYRLKPDILNFTIDGCHIGQVTAFSAEEAAEWFERFFSQPADSHPDSRVAQAFRDNITRRLDALQKAGLGYIQTNRIVGSLSGGEYQRLQLAGLVRAPLTGVAYLLDEPSFGLHRKDILRINDLIISLKQHGNTLIVVDHSPLILEKSDFTIELGPGAGKEGGEVMYSGPTRQTGDPVPVHLPGPPSSVQAGGGIRIRGARANNLQQIDLEIESGKLTVITGVSGSGKTSLLNQVIAASHQAGRPVNCSDISGFDEFAGVIHIDQPLPGTGHLATVGSLTGIQEPLAKIFSSAEPSLSRRYKTTHFVRSARDGRCPACEGSGQIQISLDFFSHSITPCETCGGTGFHEDVLDVRVGGVSIYEALQIPFQDLGTFFSDHLHPTARNHAKTIVSLACKTGLGHLNSGRMLKTLSTGELQRLKLVSGFSRGSAGHQLILLDEPTGGLHPADTTRLIGWFRELVDSGHTLICVTHDPLVMKASDGLIELGPGGGVQGGRIIRR